MKKYLLFSSSILIVLMIFSLSWSQTTIVEWNFPNDPDDAIADGGIAVNNSKTISTVGGTSTLGFTFAGASTQCAHATGWDNGLNTKYWEVEFSTQLYNQLTVSSKQRSSNTGPRDFKIQYKVGAAGTWTDLTGASITVGNNWTSGVVNSISLPTACDNQISVFLRWIMTSNTSVGGGSVGSGGTSRMDDLIILSALDNPLPIELSSFNVFVANGKIKLRWTTESEIDNVGFEIVRSFEKEGNYQTIATYLNNPELKGQGNSSARTHYSFTDVTVAPGNTYWYKLVDVDNNGNRTFHGPISITLKKGVHPISETFPNNFKLYANYPNPFNPSTTLRFDIPKLSSGVIHADLIIYNSLGEIVSVLHKGAIAPGSYEVIWDGTDSAGNLLPSGIYYAQIHADFYRQTVKMVMLK